MANTIIVKDLLQKETIKLLDRMHVIFPWANTKYEGALKAQGDTVSVQTFPNVVGVEGGTAGDDIPEENFTITSEDLVVDQAFQVNVPVKDIEKVQSNLDLMGKLANRFSYRISDILDKFIASFYSDANVPTANKINTGSPVTLTKSNAFAQMELCAVALDNQNVPRENRALFVDPSSASLLRQAPEFDGFKEGLDVRKNGFIGRMSGFELYVTNNYPTTASAKFRLGFDKEAINFVSQMTRMDIKAQPQAFRDNILMEVVYGGKVFAENGKRITTNEIAL